MAIDIDIKSVFYGRREILRNISFALTSPSLTAVIGRNGSGKSTLISAISGLARYEGRVTVEGDEVNSTDRKTLATRISLVPQETNTVVMCSSRDKGADARKLCANACIGCKKCEKNCDVQAIRVENNLAVINYDQCTRCGRCVEGCPTGCLKSVFFPDLPPREERDPV